jgi:hypothetical protein
MSSSGGWHLDHLIWFKQAALDSTETKGYFMPRRTRMDTSYDHDLDRFLSVHAHDDTRRSPRRAEVPYESRQAWLRAVPATRPGRARSPAVSGDREGLGRVG